MVERAGLSKKVFATIDSLSGAAMIGLRFAADDLRHRIPTSDGSSTVGKVSAVVSSFVLWQLGWRALSSRRSRDVTLTLNAQFSVKTDCTSESAASSSHSTALDVGSRQGRKTVSGFVPRASRIQIEGFDPGSE